MSERVGERKGSGPFKEGTIKNACYEVLKNAGPRGLTVSDIVERIRGGGLAKLGGATPANTIVGQLSKDANFVLVCKATYALHSESTVLESNASERSGFQHSESRKRKYQSESEVSGCGAALLIYRPGLAVEVLGKCKYDARQGRGGKWRAGTIASVDDESATVRLDTDGDESVTPPERFELVELSKRVRPTPPAVALPVAGRVLNEEVDVLINHVWTEGLVTKVHREGQITVAFPGVDGADSREVVVFADSSGDVWAREAFNKKGAKRAGLRRGWAFSGTLSGKWLVRGQACASAVTSDCHDGEASTFLRGEAPRRRVAARAPGDAPDTGAIYGHGESSPSASFGGDGGGNGPAFKSLSDACHHLLLGAGAAGLQVSTLVRAIQSRNLVKLGGRTPSNTVYSRLSQDARFVNVSRGAYALASVVSGGGGGTAASTPTKFSAASKSATTAALVAMRLEGAGDAAASRLAPTAALGVDAHGGHAEDDVGSVHGDDGNENESPMESEAAAAGGARAAAVAAAAASAAGDQLGCSSAFTRGEGAAAALAAGAASVASAEDMETELSAGLLMGLRSGVRRVSA